MRSFLSTSWTALWRIATMYQLWVAVSIGLLAIYIVSNRDYSEKIDAESKARTEQIEQERVRDDQLACERGLENQAKGIDRDKREFIGVVADLINMDDGDLTVITAEEQASIDKVTPVIEARIEREGSATPPPAICVTIGFKGAGR